MKLLLILLLVRSIQCQFSFGFDDLVNKTKVLQEIERFGDKVAEKVEDLSDKASEIKDDVKNTINRYFGGSEDEETKKFINETMKTMSKGVCVEEVPTASLFNSTDDTPIPRGNGTDPSRSQIHVCCDGYKRNPLKFRECSPICSNNCTNGLCISPEECACYPKFVKNLQGECVETCEKGGSCEHGNCDGDGKCKCQDGYEAADNEEQLCVLKCEEGFKNIKGVCKPVCVKGCTGGECVAPNVCKCNGDTKLDITGTQCIGSCEKQCLNGVCSGLNKCTCKTGYYHDNYDKFRCVPKCLPQCINSVCSAPNKCLCYAGYVKDLTTPGSFKCIKN